MIEFFKNIDLITLIGFVAGMFTAISMLPQVIKTSRKKKAQEVSLIMLLVLITGILLWIWYGIKKNDYPIIITNIISLIINLTMVYLRHKYKYGKDIETDS